MIALVATRAGGPRPHPYLMAFLGFFFGPMLLTPVWFVLPAPLDPAWVMAIVGLVWLAGAGLVIWRWSREFVVGLAMWVLWVAFNALQLLLA